MILAINKLAKRDYTIQKTYQAGIELLGSEVKSLRQSKASLKGSYVKVVNHQAFLLNAQINPYSFADNKTYDPVRSRKLLLHKKEIIQLEEANQKKGIALVPLSFELVNNKIKLNIGIGQSKKEYEKRADLKKKAIQRDIDRQFKDRLKVR